MTIGQEQTVKNWFWDAKTYKRGVGINLYYKPFADAWAKLTSPVIYKGVDTGLVEFEGGIYTRSSGPGDCECTLWFLGEVNDEPRQSTT